MSKLRRAAVVAPVRTAFGTFDGSLRGARYGLETMCVSGGQGVAAVFERA